jgi:hypothetical protein
MNNVVAIANAAAIIIATIAVAVIQQQLLL